MEIKITCYNILYNKGLLSTEPNVHLFLQILMIIQKTSEFKTALTIVECNH